MNIKFTGAFEELKGKLRPLSGEWDENQLNKKVLRVNGGVLNWFESTGTLSVQGRNPGKDQLESSVPHLIYPDEYPKNAEILTPIEKSSETSVLQTESFTIEQQYLTKGLNESELVIGLVNAVGTEYQRVLDPLRNRLGGFNYEVKEIRLSTQLLESTANVSGEYERIKHYINKGDELRKKSKNNAILAAGAISKIIGMRTDDQRKTVYIINSLKHPDEVEFLRKVYGGGFFLFGIHSDEKRRYKYLVDERSLTDSQANELIRIDEDERLSHGQRTRDTFHLSDFFVSLGKNDDHVKNTIQRFLELIFSNPFRSPTFDEFAMFMAFNSSIRSSDLSRQVGAIIARDQQIIATGANDTPKYGGGQYWAEIDPSTGEVKDYPDGKDYTREVDSNKVAQKEIIGEIANALIEKCVVDENQKSEIEKVLRQSRIADITEYGRVVHAEMEAILSCGRAGISTLDGTLYCTTFPCHNCAKHIIDAGIKRVVYVEPYPKSKALELHSESIELKENIEALAADNRVVFEPFIGVGARRFIDLFSTSLGNGLKLKRKEKAGNAVEWKKDTAKVRTPLLPKSYLEIEKAALEIWKQV